MNAEEIWKIGELGERIGHARGKLYGTRDGWFSDSQGRLAHMLHILALPGYHQPAEIAETFGLEPAELGLNEDECETARKRIKEVQANLLRDLHDRLDVAPGISLRFDYDPAGNFGLMISMAGEIPSATRKAGPNLSYPPVIAHS